MVAVCSSACTANDAFAEADDERARQESVVRYGLCGALAWEHVEPRLNTLADQARRIVGAESAAINVFDGRRQARVRGKAGSPASVLPRGACAADTRGRSRVHASWRSSGARGISLPDHDRSVVWIR
jgi:hypothetical protein